MTPERILELRELCENATEGPWVDDGEGCIEDGSGALVCVVQEHGNIRTMIATGEEYSHADARFIAAARLALPEALDALTTLRAENERLRGLLARWDRWAVNGGSIEYEAVCRDTRAALEVTHG